MGKTALVLGGGGVRGGAYEAGALRAIAQLGIVPDVIVGVSAGALNGLHVAALVSGGRFTPRDVQDTVERLWLERTSAEEIYRSEAVDEAPGGYADASARRLLDRMGIDPFRPVPLIRLGLDTVMALRELLSGRVTSVCTHGLLRSVIDQSFVVPPRIVRPVAFSVAVTDILGTTRVGHEGIEAEHCQYVTMRLAPEDAPEAIGQRFNSLRDPITASCSVPVVFPPVLMRLPGRDRTGLYVDGGLIEHAPVTHAIELDPDVDTVIVVMAATPVPEARRAPLTFLQLVGRLFAVMAGRYLIQNVREVALLASRIEALAPMLERDAAGNVVPSPFNERLCAAAGFGDTAGYMSQRPVRLAVVAPSEPLGGGTFTPFLQSSIKAEYVAIGRADAIRVLERLAPVRVLP